MFVFYIFICLSISCVFVILYSIMILLDFIEFIKNNVISAKLQHSGQYAFEVQAVDTPLLHWRFL